MLDVLEQRYERIAGMAVMLAPAGTGHNGVGGNLHLILGNYLRGKRCKVFYETMVFLDEQNHFIPDLMVVCDRSKIKYNGIEGAPDLVVEILSPSTKKRDIGVKKKIYAESGVKEYWIVSPKEKSIEVYLQAEGDFRLDNVYHDYEPWEWEMLTEEEKAEERFCFQASLYDDLEIDVREVFRDVVF